MFSNAADLPKATNEKERQRNIRVASQHNSYYNNPCMVEQKLSYKCLSDNNFDKDACATVFENYKACKDFWTKVKADRKNRGVVPALPRPEEREGLKAEYMKKFHSTGR